VPKVTMNHYVAPLIVWLAINGFIANSLQGAGFLIIPVFFGLFAFGVFIITQKSNWVLNLVCSIPALLIIAPFIQMFPIGLGLKVLFGSAILTVLTFGLLLPVFGAFTKKITWSLLCFVTSVLFFTNAHLASGYEAGKAKSNSLIYFYNADTKEANWLTYDINLDRWTRKYLGDSPKDAQKWNSNPLYSKYNSGFTYAADAPRKGILKPTIEFLRDSIVGNRRHLKIRITPNRKVNRYDVFANEKMNLYHFKANGAQTIGQKGTLYERNGKKILSFYVVDNEPLEMEFAIDKTSFFDMDLLESSFDLMHNPLFDMEKREDWMMPTPFVLNDAVVIKQKIIPSPAVFVSAMKKRTEKAVVQDSLTIAKDSLEVKIAQ